MFLFFFLNGHLTIFAKRNGRHLKRNIFFNVLFADLWLSKVYTDMVQALYQNSWGKVLKNGWVQVDPSALCTNGSEKLLRHKSVKSYDSAITAMQRTSECF